MGLLNRHFVNLSRIFRDCALIALEALCLCIEVPNCMSRMNIASDFSWLEASLHLLDQVLAEVWRINAHHDQRWFITTPKGAFEVRGLKFGDVAWLTQDVVTTPKNNWHLGRQIEVLIAHLTHHVLIFISSLRPGCFYFYFLLLIICKFRQ